MQADPHERRGSDPRKHLRRVVALLAGLVIATAMFLLRWFGILDGIAAITVAVLLAVLLPWSTYLSRRLLLAGAVFLGWMPLLWWVRLPVPEVDRVGIVVALSWGALAGWVLWGPDLRTRLRRLVPRVGVVDAMPAAAAAVAVWTTWPLLAASDGSRSLSVLMNSSWDHAFHAGMVMQIRAQGAIVPMLGSAPDGTTWPSHAYPQHFHATVTALTDLYHGPVVGDTATEVLLYGRSLALVQVLTAVLLAAGVAQLPSLRRRALFAWPLAAMVVGVFLFGPGSRALSLSQPNFVLACATVGLAVLLAVPMSRELVPLRVFALGGLIVATAHGWALVAPLAVVAGCVALVPFSRARWPRSRTGWLSTIAALTATVAASVAVIPMLLSAGGMGILGLGGVSDLLSNVSAISTALLAGGMAFATALAAYVRGQTSESSMKGLSLTVMAGADLLLLGGLVVHQLLTSGGLSYYFRKLDDGVVLISIVVLAASIALHVGPPSPVRSRVRRSMAVTVSIVAAVAASQVLGLEGVEYRYDAKHLALTPAPAQRILSAAAIAQARPFGSTVYVAAMPGDPHAGFADLWERQLNLAWTSGAYEVNRILFLYAEMNPSDGADDLAEAVEVTRKVLEEAPQLAVIMAPEIADSVRRLLPVELRSRVITWESP